MAYAAVVSLAHTLENFILLVEYRIFDAIDEHDGARRAFESLFADVALIRDFLEKFSGKARRLEPQINDSANEVECLIEYFISDLISSKGWVRAADLHKFLLETNRIAARIEPVVRELKEMVDCGSAKDDDDSSTNYDYLPRNSITEKDRVLLGFDNYLSEIKADILSHVAELMTVPIVGMGGIGKTTLARAAFDDPRVIDRFDIRRWVTASQSCYSIRATYSALLGENHPLDDTASISDLSVMVHQLLKKRRYLIVVDDIWSSNVWDDVKRTIPDDCNRSRVLLTTRDESVANYALSSSTIHRLKLMDVEISWCLFERLVFGEKSCPPELMSEGKIIVKGCGGLPLAISVVSGILSNVGYAADSWKRISEDVNGALSNGDKHFTDILSLSYYHLPAHLQPCFLYISAFPEDYEINKSYLVKCLVAEGFLEAGNTKDDDADEIVGRYLDDLLKRNLIMVTDRKWDGEVTHFGIHDLLREIGAARAKEENFFHDAKDANLDRARRVTFNSKVSSQVVDAYLSSIRTALVFHHDGYFTSKLQRLRLLRVLDARSIGFKEFPTQILRLYHLRYLAFCYSKSSTFEIPPEICLLKNLETLMVRSKQVYGIVIVPPEILMMRKLRHLELESICVMPSLLTESGFCLENLKTLSHACNFKFDEKLLATVATLRKLIVHIYLDDKKDETWSDYGLHNLHRLRHLERLKICLELTRYDLEWCKRNPMLGCIVFPRNLKKLCIMGCAARIPWEDVNDAIGGSLANLEELRLACYSCSGDVWETKEGCFEKLRLLYVSDSNLKCWLTENISHFPSLEYIYLFGCRELVELPDCIGDVPTLRGIHSCRNSEAVRRWASRIEEEQREIGNDIIIYTESEEALDQLRILIEEFRSAEENLSKDQFAERLALLAGNGDKNGIQAVMLMMLNAFDWRSEDPYGPMKKVFMEAMHKSWIKQDEDEDEAKAEASTSKQ